MNYEDAMNQDGWDFLRLTWPIWTAIAVSVIAGIIERACRK